LIRISAQKNLILCFYSLKLYDIVIHLPSLLIIKMNRSILTALFLLSIFTLSYSQVFTDSNLPLVIINTDGGLPIPDDPRVNATMKIISRGDGARNSLKDENTPEYLNYNGRIDIEIRGSSSQAFDKKQYGFSTKKEDIISANNVSLLGLPKDNDWILNSMVFDPSLIRNYLSFFLSRTIGEYASRGVFCEVFINGFYTGIYLLEEKIKAGPNRIDILKIKPDDNNYPDITGGYITKADKTTGGDPIAWSMSSYIGFNDVGFIHDLPDPEDVTSAQDMFIKGEFMKLSTTAAAGNASLTDGYPSVIDIPSFVDFMLLNELAANADAYQFSTFFHKDRNGKLRAGPLWDMDLTFGNDLFMWSLDRSKTDTWQFSNGDNEGARFWRDLFRDQTFKCYLSRRWHQVTRPGQPFTPEYISFVIDRVVDTISEAAVRENIRWGTTGDNYPAQIAAMKTFLQQRISWITNNLGSYSACDDPVILPLVITKIMYAPDTSALFPVSNDLEFIEITNTGNETTDLTGICFGGTGFVYKFPANSKIAPGESKILAGSSAVFMTKYGFYPSGQFTRSLSNTGEKLILEDGFGNVIDYVEYSDQLPWPDVKANGLYLELGDPLSDNNIGSNWTASSSVIVSVEESPEPGLLIYPSPVKDKLHIETDVVILTVKLYSFNGDLLQSIAVNSESCNLRMSSYPKALYIVRIAMADHIIVRKIIKD
jgi:hypothetical protein